MNGHRLAERSDVLRKSCPGLAAEAVGPLEQGAPRGLEESRALVLAELAGQHHRREPGPMQDLVRVCVADPAEQPRIGERALQRVILAREGGAKGCEIGGEHLEPAGVMVIEPVLASDEVKRGAPSASAMRRMPP